jgi:hypothetical protein
MNTVEEIIIKVPSNIAAAYRRITKEEQEQIQLKLALFIESNLLNDRKEAIQKLRNTMDEVSKEAQAKGLNPEILESILQDDE